MQIDTRWRPGRKAVWALSLGLVTVLPAPCWADNPIVQTSYTADPAPMVHDGRLYLYTSHDEDVTVNDFFTMNEWRVYSTVDMVNWTDHGSPASYRTFSWGTGDAWAPHGAARDGKFYLYVPLNNSTGARIGVGVSTSPLGPFTDAIGSALVSTGTGDIDPTVFIDDDGQAYMYWGNPNLWHVKLNPDMISTSGSPSQVSLTDYVEGPWFYKRGSIYYMVYPAGGIPEKISYGTSSGPEGPWTYRGDIMDPQTGAGASFTNHPGVIDFEGHSYFFYHNAALPGGGGFKRSVCVEEFTYGDDGSIPRIEMTQMGPSAIATLNPFEQVEAETIAFSSGLKTEVCTDTGAGMNVTAIHDGDYIKVRDVDFGDGVTSFDARVSSAGSSAQIELHLDSQNGPLLGTCDVSGASSWTTKTCSVSGASGTHDLFLRFTGGSGELFKLNWWKFTGPGGSNGGGGAGGEGAGGAGGIGASGSAGVDTGGFAGSGAAQGTAGASNGGTASGSGGSSDNAGGSLSTSGGTGDSAGGAFPASGGSANAAGGAIAANGGSLISAGGTSSTSGGATAHTGGTTSPNGSTTGGLAEGNGAGGIVGAPGAGGQLGTTPGSAASAGSGPADSSSVSSDDSSCSCRVGTKHRNGSVPAALCLAGLALLRRRWRAGRRARPWSR